MVLRRPEGLFYFLKKPPLKTVPHLQWKMEGNKRHRPSGR
nr:MAG TPA: hypothetical protein [Caudoviricetes sp.]